MYKIKENFVLKEIENGLLLIDITQNKNIFQFNNFGEIILKNLSMPKAEFLDMIMNKYNVKKNRLSKDYDKFIKILLYSDIIEVNHEK